MIEIQNVSFTYAGTHTPALRDVSLTVPRGQLCALIGANGAGKSTLAYLIAGFVPHFFHGQLSGEVHIVEKSTHSASLADLILSVGMVFQNPFNQISGTKFTVREEIAFGLENLGIPRADMIARVDETMMMVGISDLADRFPLSLSGGQMQRVAIASVLAMRPQILVLDEPTSQLDPAGSHEVFETIRRLMESNQVTVVIAEHKLEWVAVFADRVVALAGGRIIADGRPKEVLADEGNYQRGVGQTRYTLAARRARDLGRWPSGKKLATTLEEAVEGFI